MTEPFKIPGLEWDELSVQQSKIQQNFVSQELARWKTKKGYLARLNHMKAQPLPPEGPINKYDPAETCDLMKVEWNNKNMTQVRVDTNTIKLVMTVRKTHSLC